MESSASQPKPAQLNLFARLLDNPIILKELKGRMRGRQGAVLLTVYLGLLSLLIVLVYLFLQSEGNFSRGADFLQQAGKALFATVVLSEMLLIAFIGPSLTSGAISAERERQTFDLLRASLLSPFTLLLGKLLSAVAYLVLLIFTAIPVQSLAFFVGGVGMAEMVVSVLLLIASALLFCMLGLYFSAIAKRPATATAMSYGVMLLPIILLFVFFLWIISSVVSPSGMTNAQERTLILLLWTVASSNPLAAAVISETMLVDEQVLFLFYPPNYHPPLALFSPWILYLVYALSLTGIMLALATFYLKRYEY